VIVFRDVSAARAMALEMTHSAQHDFLTGMPNRMLLNDRVNQALAWAQRNSKKVAVLFLDLDGFKHINDSLGHPTGDKLLQSIAKRLVDCVRGSDTVSRQGRRRVRGAAHRSGVIRRRGHHRQKSPAPSGSTSPVLESGRTAIAVNSCANESDRRERVWQGAAACGGAGELGTADYGAGDSGLKACFPVGCDLSGRANS
jgi:hypothetical protein